MTEKKIIGNYLLFDNLDMDTFVLSHRTGELQDRKVVSHKILSEVHPYWYKDSKRWEKIKRIFEGMKSSHINQIILPEKILTQKDEKALLVYDYFAYRSLEQIINQAKKKRTGISLELALSIIIGISEIIELGYTVVINGKKSFHGFLTPDNIVMNSDGTIFLKNYSLLPYLQFGDNDEALNSLKEQYGSALPPELIKDKQVYVQTDIFFLGNLILKMLTGKTLDLKGTDFQTALKSISFDDIDAGRIENFGSKLIPFLEKCLNPDYNLRFANVKELREYITNVFHLEELSSFTFNIAYFLNSVMGESFEEEEGKISGELGFELEEEEEEEATKAGGYDPELVAELLEGLDETKGFNKKIIIGSVSVLVLVLIVGFFIFNSLSSKNKKLDEEKKKIAAQQEKERQEREKEILKLKKEQAQALAQIKAQQEQLQEKLTQTEKEMQKAKTAEEKRRLAQKQEKIRVQKEELLKKQTKVLEEKKEVETVKITPKDVDAQPTEEYKTIVAKAKKLMKEYKFKEAKGEILKAQSLKDGDEVKNIIAKIDKELKVEQDIKAGKAVPASFADVPAKVIAGKFRRKIRKKLDGKKVKVRLIINIDGTFSSPKILNKELVKDFIFDFTSDLQNWKFVPAQRNGKNIKVVQVIECP